MSEDGYWEHPLALWLSDCASGSKALVPESSWRLQTRLELAVQYKELCDGVLLSLLFKEIDPRSVSLVVVGDTGQVRDFNFRHRIFNQLLEAIRRFYKVRLNQIVVLAPPDILSIVKSLTPDESGEELNKFILLLLGCAVQSERKKEFIERITRFSAATQQGIAQHIRKITEGSSTVLSVHSLQFSDPVREVAGSLERVVRERDALASQIMHMSINDNESDEGSSTTATSSLNGDVSHKRPEIRYEPRTPSPTFDRHCNVELATVKSELRKARRLAEDRDDECFTLNSLIKLKDKEIEKYCVERQQLIKDAAAVRELKDEKHFMESKISKAEKIEDENRRLREKMKDFVHYKDQHERHRKESDMQMKALDVLEQENDELKQHIKSLTDVEGRFDELKAAKDELQENMMKKNDQIEQLLREQQTLESELRRSTERIKDLEKGNPTPRESFGSLADELEETERSEACQLRIEVRKLKAQLEAEQQKRSVSLPAQSTQSDDFASEDFVFLQTELDVRNKELEEVKEEYEIITKQLHQLEKTLSAVNCDYKEIAEQLDEARTEKDDAVRALHDARRKFTQFQTEFGKKYELEFEMKVREAEVELSEQRRRLSSAEEERDEIQKQMEKVREEMKSQRGLVDDLKEEKHQLELQCDHLERSLKNAENEKSVVRERAGKLEDELESLRLRMITTDDAARRLENSERLLVEMQNRVGDVEAENRSLQQQLELETQKTQRLREEFVAEKAKGAELIGRLRSLCGAIALNGGKIDADIDDLKLIATIDDIIMTTLTQAKRESDALRLQQHTQIAELNDLRRDIEKLRRSESASLSESDDRVRELSKENVNIKEQVFLLQEKIRELQIEISTKNSEIASAKREIEELNTNATVSTSTNQEVARLTVANRNLSLQEELLKQDVSELRSKLNATEKSKASAKKDTDSLSSMHQALLSDHDRLQNLHDLLTQDYERTKQENQEMKIKIRNQRPSPPACLPNREAEDLRMQLAQEKSANDRQLRAYADLQNEHGAVRRDIEALRKENDLLSRQCDNLSSDVRNLKLSDQAQRVTIRDLSATVDELNRALQAKEVEIAKLHNRIEMLTQMNRTYDEESKNLNRQVEMLLHQNKELLNRALNDKDQYHQEQKDFQERLSALRRHKDKLEEKIMDQYRSMESKRSTDRPKQPLVKRAAKALISRRRPSQPSSQGGSTTEDSSAYSADEASPNFNDDDMFPPTCSSSDDVDRNSPKYDSIKPIRDLSPMHSGFRRGDPIGGSVRVYSTMNRASPLNGNYEKITLNGPERNVDHPSCLPPRAPVRNSSVTASLRVRPPPPPYNKKPTPVIQYQPPHRTSTPVTKVPVHSVPSSPSPANYFVPNYTSTPNSSPSGKMNDRTVVGEGEKRTFIREKEERVDKALSYYENVQQPEVVAPAKGPNESTHFYDYGCV